MKKKEIIQDSQKMNNREAAHWLKESYKLNNLKGFPLMMAISDAVERLEKEQKILLKLKEYSEEYKEYQKKVEQINGDYSNKDAAGSPKMKTQRIGDQTYQYFDLDEKYEDERVLELDALDKANSELIAEQKKKEEDYQAALEEESTLVFVDFPAKKVPEDITVEQGRILRKLVNIKEREEKK